MKKERIEETIKNIEQLSTDARYFINNNKSVEELQIKLESIEWWVKVALKKLEKGEK